MVNVKATAAVLVASMSLFSAVPAAAASNVKAGAKLRDGSVSSGGTSGGSTPVTGSSGGSTSGSGSGAPTTSPSGSSTSSGSGSTTTSSSGGGSTSTNGASGSSIGGSNNGLGGASSSPVSSGNRTTGGNNSSRPGPRAPVDQPGANGTGPFTERGNNQPRTTDGTEKAGFNFGNLLSGFNSMTSTLFQLVATFAMLKNLFGWGKEKKGADAVKEVAAVADRGTNVARDAATKIDKTLEEERARRDAAAAAEAENAEKAGLARD